MLPEIGHFSLILSLFFAVAMAIIPVIGYVKKQPLLMLAATPLTYVVSLLVLLSFVILVYGFVTDDFSVWYIAQNSNSHLPVWFKASATWGGHEGSLLLWVLILGGWSSAVALKGRTLPKEILALVLATLGAVTTGFLSFLLFTSSPFIRILPDTPQEGADLNPLLQDIGLIIHPPMLYMGYVGFSVAFAFAIAALITGNLNSSWARWARPWTSFSWAFLTLGITLGSWWAYYELGWGGWWFWDPVENASFMPWLAGTALIHSLAVTEKRGVFKSWTVLLAIFTFSLSLLGTFLVRSGVLTSVHAFAADPTRGVFILVLLSIMVGGSLLLYAVRAVDVKSEVNFGLTGREAGLLLNNIILVTLALTVLIGTLYPLIFDAFGLGKISVGAPYFNAIFSPIALLLMLLMGLAPLLKWNKTKASMLSRQLIVPIVLAFTLSGLTFIWQPFDWMLFICLMIAFWVVILCLIDLLSKIFVSSKNGWQRLLKLPRNYYGMLIAHMGLVVTLIGIVFVSLHSEEEMVKMSPNDKVSLSGYEFIFNGVEKVRGANYSADRAELTVYKNNKLVTVLHPEKRLYSARGQVMTEAAIDGRLFRDLYVSLGEQLDDGAWSIRTHVKPFVRWIWLGGLLMTFGGFLSALDKRYRKAAGVSI